MTTASRTDRMLALAFPACLTDIDPMALHAEPATAETTDCARLADAFTLYSEQDRQDANTMHMWALYVSHDPTGEYRPSRNMARAEYHCGECLSPID